MVWSFIQSAFGTMRGAPRISPGKSKKQGKPLGVGACLVSRWAYGLLRDSGRTLLDRQAPATVRDAVRGSLERFHDTRVVDLHVWSIGPGLLAAEIAVLSHQPKEPSVYKELLSDLGLAHVTIEVHRCPGDPCL